MHAICHLMARIAQLQKRLRQQIGNKAHKVLRKPTTMQRITVLSHLHVNLVRLLTAVPQSQLEHLSVVTFFSCCEWPLCNHSP